MRGKRVAWWLVPVCGVMLVAVGVGAAHEKGHINRVVMFDGSAWLGVHISDVTPEEVRTLKLPGEYGVVIEKVVEDSPAAQAGLEENDVLLAFADERVRSVAHLRRLVRETPPGRQVTLQVSRSGQTRSVEVTLEKRRVRLPEIHVGRIEIPPVEIPEFDIRVFGHGPRLGISGDDLTPQLADYFGVKQGKGVLVREVLAGSAAAEAGLKAGDVIVRVDDKGVGSVRELRRALRRPCEDKEVTLTIVRDRREQTIKVELEEPKRSSPRRTAEVDFGLDPEAWEEFAAAMEAKAAKWEKLLKRWQQEFQQKFRQHQTEWEERLREAEREMWDYIEPEQFQEKMRGLGQKLKDLERTLHTVGRS